MIDQMDQIIKTWIEGLPLNCHVLFQLPDGETPADNTVLVRLLETNPTLPLCDARSATLQIALCYLITVHHSDVTIGHRLLADLIFDAMQNTTFEIDTDPFPLELWSLFGSSPQPSFRIRPHVRLEQARRPMQSALRPLRVPVMGTSELHGLVMGPQNKPIMNATVECREMGIYTRTGSDGRFYLPLLPAQKTKIELIINASGAEHRVVVCAGTTHKTPFIVHIESIEHSTLP